MTREAVPLGSTGHLLHRATLPRPGDLAVLPSTWKQTQGVSKNEKTKKSMSQRKEQDKIPEKEQNKMETSNLPDAV